MREYHKIQSVFKRDPETKYKTFLEGEWARPEFEYLADNLWRAEEKIDGTNIRIMYKTADDCDYHENQLKFGGRTDKADIPSFLVSRLDDLFSVDKFQEHFDCPVTLYGEGYGARVQKSGGNYIPDGVDFVLFDVLINGMWLQRHDVIDIAQKLGIDVVPDYGNVTLHRAIDMCKAGFDSHWGWFMAEGLVLKPTTELQNRLGKRIVTKLKCGDFNYV